MDRFAEAVTRLKTIPRVDRLTAWGLLAEIGFDPNQFRSSAHLASWVGLCPGRYESVGIGLSDKTRRGSLRRCLCQAAWGITRQKKHYLAALYHRLAARRGGKRAVIAVAHALLVMAYRTLPRKSDDHEPGPDYFDRLKQRQFRHALVRRLKRLGHNVILQPAAPVFSQG